MSGEPIRLLNDSSIRDELRERLAREAAAKPQYDIERGLARLRAAIATGAVGPSSESEPASGRLSVTNYAVKGSVWRVAGVVGLAAISAVVGLRAWGPAQNVGRTEALAAAMAPQVPPAPALTQPSSAAGEVAEPASGSDAPRRMAASEADNLAQIEAVLHSDPQRALLLADDGNHAFAQGSLHEQREAFAIAALGALGRTSQARSRAQRFLKNFPKSPLSERVRQSAKL